VNKLYYVDGDNDGYGSNVSKWIAVAVTPAGYANNNTDCNDSRLLYADNDGDGLGAGSPVACGVTSNTDCDDTNPNNQVTVCHKGRAICVAVSAVYAHLCHGDKLGSCEIASPGMPGDGGGDAIIYPNPAKDHLTVRVGSLHNGARVQLYNALGRLMITKNLTSTVTTISLRGLSDGMYYVRVKNGHQITIQKIIKK
jgi:hypothetical protein